jgi:protocatechuate 3,4-dioxygenase beta subunit
MANDLKHFADLTSPKRTQLHLSYTTANFVTLFVVNYIINMSVTGNQMKCSLTPTHGEGPFYLPNQPIRSNITEGKPGLPLKIHLNIKDQTCKPIQGAEVHLWHSDALGHYSAYSGYYPLGDPSKFTLLI